MTKSGRPDKNASTVSEANASEHPAGQDPARWRVLIVLLVAIFMSLISVSIVNVALPSIQAGLDASDSDVQWVLSGYALTFGVVLVAAGRAGDLVGRGGIFLVGIAIYTLASASAGFAPNAESLNLSRFIQGIGAGLLNPQGVGMIQQYFRGAERGRAFGYFGSTVGVAVAIGPVLGGFLIRVGGADLGWRLTMLVNFPIGLLAIVLGLMWFPRPLFSRVRDSAGEKVGAWQAFKSLDPVGALLLGLAVLCVLFPFVESSGSRWVWALLPAGAVCVAIWVAWERHHKSTGHEPMVDLGIFQTFTFRNGTIIATLWFMGITSIWVLVALYFQNGLGYSALVAGCVGLPSALLNSVTATLAGKSVSVYGRRVVIIGMLTTLFGLVTTIAVIWGTTHWSVSEWWLVLTLCFVGAGQGAVVSPNQTLTLAEVPANYAGSSGAVMQTGQRIGTAVGLAVTTAIVFATLGNTDADWPGAIIMGFAMITAVCLAALGFGVADRVGRRR
ncbi:MFS transporter [Corynebacterium sp. HMSC04H06]|uniref:MFS transporter n=1 Tax=Corynebacterium sp. HMSC04H06 TaxID=1581050 RepID=UPI0008A52D0C|nr:MFS transporter [Corynebacterium sp. HMSC04H06]OFS22198.1 MFS transporter permease [Corynebacterium sp. HMSC04H06]